MTSVAIIGCGHWGSNHVRVMHELGAEVVLCDTDTLRLDAAEQMGLAANRYTDYQDVLADGTIDAVVLATPATTHYRLAREAFLANKHVLVEKPMALVPAQAAELIHLAKQHSKVLMVGHLMRFHPGILKLKELVENGVLGNLRYIYSTRLNMGKVRREENALWSFAPHDVSITLHLMDQLPTQVSATGGAYLQPNIADVSLSSMEFENGARSHIFVSWLHPFREQRLVVVGSRRMAVFDDLQPNDKLGLFDIQIDMVSGNFVTKPPQRQPIPIVRAEPLLAEDHHFLSCIETGASPSTDGLEGLSVLTVLNACQESLMLGGAPVALDNSQILKI